jgi:hypothetical protein
MVAIVTQSGGGGMQDHTSNDAMLCSVRAAGGRCALKTRRATVGTLLLSLVFQMVVQAGSARGAAAVKLTEQEEHDSYAIYSMLLKQGALGVHSAVLGIQQERKIFRPVAGVDELPCDWPKPSPEQRKTYQPLIEDFKRRNARPLLLQEKFDLPSYRLLTNREVREVDRKHPVVTPPPGTQGPPQEERGLSGINAVFLLSAVGFTPDHERALVYVATRTGGQYYFLVRKDGKWTIDKDYHGTVCGWVT